MTAVESNGHRGDGFARLTMPDDAQQMLEVALDRGIPTVWDRLAAQEPQCGYCALGVSCRNCAMGPCRIDPFGEGPQKGVCGADADLIVARNLGRTIAAGSSSHSDHGRDILEVFAATAKGETTGYKITDEAKLRRLAEEWNVATGDRPLADIASRSGRRDVRRTTAAARRRSASSSEPRSSAGRCGSGWASRRAGSTARTSRCSTGPTWASTATTPTSCSTPCAPAWPTAGAAR